MNELKANTIWQHYKSKESIYLILGVSVNSREPVSRLTYFGKEEFTNEDIAIYDTVKGNLKLYKTKIKKDGDFKILNVIKEPYVVYTALHENSIVWCRLLSDFMSITDTGVPRFKYIKDVE